MNSELQVQVTPCLDDPALSKLETSYCAQLSQYSLINKVGDLAIVAQIMDSTLLPRIKVYIIPHERKKSKILGILLEGLKFNSLNWQFSLYTTYNLVSAAKDCYRYRYSIN